MAEATVVNRAPGPATTSLLRRATAFPGLTQLPVPFARRHFSPLGRPAQPAASRPQSPFSLFPWKGAVPFCLSCSQRCAAVYLSLTDAPLQVLKGRGLGSCNRPSPGAWAGVGGDAQHKSVEFMTPALLLKLSTLAGLLPGGACLIRMTDSSQRTKRCAIRAGIPV